MLLEMGIKTTGLPRTLDSVLELALTLGRGTLPSCQYLQLLFHTKVAETISHHEEASGPPTIHHFFN